MDHQVIRIVDALCEDVGTPRALAVRLLVRAGEWAQLQQLRVKPSDYDDSESYWRDNLVTELLRKCDLPSDVDKEAAAVRTFEECELQNARTNIRLTRFLPESLFIETAEEETVYQFISEWRKEVDWVMGGVPACLTPRFSNGATYADTGKLITIPDKMSSIPHMYEGNRCLLPFFERTSWFRLRAETGAPFVPVPVRGNIFFTVPKDGTKFRGCGKEASMAICLQLDAGRTLRQRLKRIGIDLQNDQEKHRQLARKGSLDGSLATMDQSNASDTLCRVLPRLVCPKAWWELLDSLRASHTRVKDRWFRLEKFSSMGNGFTFELETIIFATLARVVVRQMGLNPDDVSCYGDDLIVPTDCFQQVANALRYFGFTPNLKKTYGTGPFRESCGGDFFNGIPVRGPYIEELPNEPHEWISLANSLRRIALVEGAPASRWSTVRRAWLRVLDCLPSHIRRLRGPEFLGDIVVHDHSENWVLAEVPDPPKGTKHLVDTYHTPALNKRWVRAWTPVPEVLPWHHWRPHVQLASCTLGLPAVGVTPRDGVSGYKVRSVPLGGSTWLPRPMDFRTER